MSRSILLLAVLFASSVAAQEEDPRHVETLVRQLGAQDADLREAASRELLEIGRPALKALREGAKSGDAEVQRRVNELYPFVRWGVRDDCPSELMQLLRRFDSAGAEGKDQALRDLVQLCDVAHRLGNPALRSAARDALATAWWDVEDPTLLADLAAKGGLDPDAIEARLSAAHPEDDPRLLRARAQARHRSGDDAAACDLYARIKGAPEDPAVSTEWGEALFHAHRFADAAEVFSRAGDASALRRAECLYRANKKADAEAVLAKALEERQGEARRKAFESALAHGSAAWVAERAGDKAVPADLAAEAWIRLGKLDHAEDAWRRVEDSAQRRRVLELLLDARGETCLLTPAFIAETQAPSAEDAKRHARLAAEIEKDRPEAALREWKKARLLDPSTEGCEAAIARLAAHASDAPGVSTVEMPAPPDELLFATPPIRCGGFYYYMNAEGDLLKVKDPVQPEPVWTYTPPLTREGRRHGCSCRLSLAASSIERRGGELLVLFERMCTLGPDVMSLENGFTLCVLDDATGREEWTREFLTYRTGARLWPEEGVVTFERYGLAVFDLASRGWRWTISGLGHGGLDLWVHGDAVYIGFASGDLCRLRLADGSPVWRKKWPGDEGWRALLRPAGERLLFCPGGGEMVALSLKDDSVAWEARPQEMDLQRAELDDERVYLKGVSGRLVEAYAIEDGKLVWQREVDIEDSACTQLDRVLWFGGVRRPLFLDKATGRVVGMAWREDGTSGQVFHPAGSVAYGCDAQPSYYFNQAEDPIDHPERNVLPRPRGRLCAARWVPTPEAPATPLPKETDVVAEVSLLEDACYGPSSADGEAWLALADACLRAGHGEWGAEAVKRGLLMTGADLPRLREWRDRLPPVESEGGREGELRDLGRQIQRWEYLLMAEESLRAGSLPPHHDEYEPTPYSFLHRVIDPSPEATMREAILIHRMGASNLAACIARRLGEVPEPLAVEGVDEMLRGAIDAEDCTRLWPGSRTYLMTCSTADIETALRERCAGPPSALRGAALATLDLLGVAVPEEGAEASLLAAIATNRPRVRLAAAAALARRGDVLGKRTILDAIRSNDKEVQPFAVWLAGNVRMAEATEAVEEDAGPYRLEALAEIGTDEAWAQVVKAAADANWQASTAMTCALSRTRTPQAIATARKIGRMPHGIFNWEVGYLTLAGMDTPASRLAALEFGRLLQRLGPAGDTACEGMARGLLEEGDVDGAVKQLARMEAAQPPSANLLALRCQVLAAKGDLEGAREARRLAEADLDRAESIDPGSWRRLVVRAWLYLEPKAIADVAKAKELLERAKALAPHDPEVARWLDKARGK